MRVLVVSKTVTNGGDFLFAKYIKNILLDEYGDIEFIFDDAFREFSEEEIRGYSAILISGGPAYDNRLMTHDYFPFLRDAFKLKVPVAIVGAGVYGKTGVVTDIYSYQFSQESLEILRNIERQGGFLGCRDFVSMEVLQNNGLSNLVMTGCPVWYDKAYFGVYSKPDMCAPKKIMISDPGVTKEKSQQISRAKQTCQVIDYIQNKFPGAKIEFTFNNGIKTKYSTECNEYIMRFLEENGITWYNLQKHAELFSVYDDADLHIGFRVHSHLYCLAHRIPSILIEEDRRGFGMNDVLGLPHIFGYDETMWKTNEFYPNEYLLNKLNNNIERVYQTEFAEYLSAYKKMDYYYGTGMKKMLNKILGVNG